ncbi:MAG TPA: YihY/virulence factor BrkB family protein [Patescibacteria group bacterium]|nr:YihY/virulence factor BrkB family protein [Patescibacteria group bacterium]
MDIGKILKKVDAWQQKRKRTSFPYAVYKKYGEDNGGYQAALLTYYGFLSLFPLLLVLITVLQIWFNNDPVVRHDISTSVGHFFPLLGDQLERNIHGMRRAGLGLVIGILFTLYGARGAADAFRYAIDNMWQVPKNKRVGFPKNILHSMAIVGAGAAGFGATAAISGFTADLGHVWWAKLLANILGACILAIVIGYTFRIATAGRLRLRYMWLGATMAAVVIQILLSSGGILVAHEFKNLNSLYGTFAVVLGMLFWIYLLAQVVLLSAEIDTVRHFKLWPRSLTGKLPTEADTAATELFTQEDKYLPNETIKARLKLK